ncbi:MAG: RNA polymerase sigma factor [Planctomycetes bacterium]|nr:RNA polymerase sigma factor [Planctomycetota bacterium]
MTSLELVERIRSGRDVRAAQEELYVLVRGALLGRLGRKIPPQLRSRVEPEDVLHAAFLKAMTHLEGFRALNEHSFVAWVHSIAKNLLADALDRRSVAMAHFAGTEEKGPRASRVPEEREGAGTLLGRREWIESLLARLAPREAEVIRLRQLEGREYGEIAAAWKSTPGAVQRFYSRAWRKFCELAQASEP